MLLLVRLRSGCLKGHCTVILDQERVYIARRPFVKCMKTIPCDSFLKETYTMVSIVISVKVEGATVLIFKPAKSLYDSLASEKGLICSYVFTAFRQPYSCSTSAHCSLVPKRDKAPSIVTWKSQDGAPLPSPAEI